MSQPTPLPCFILLFAMVYAAFGIASPFLPRFWANAASRPSRPG